MFKNLSVTSEWGTEIKKVKTNELWPKEFAKMSFKTLKTNCLTSPEYIYIYIHTYMYIYIHIHVQVL
jgi:hypothetical protein